ncbi:unnamed protein product [Pylaiella littoralis]
MLTADERRRERRASSERRKSGPKVVDIEWTRQDGKAGRRRQSDQHRRASKSNKAAALRHERGQLRPPLAGHSGRASLRGSCLPPATTTTASATEAAAATAAAAATSKEESRGIVTMEVAKQEEEEGKEEEGRKKGDGSSEAEWTPDMVAEAAQAVLGDDRQLQIRHLRWLRKVLSLSEAPPAEQVVRAGLLPRLVGFIRQTDCAELRPEALCALANIACTEYTKEVAMEPGILPVLVSVLGGPDMFLREQSAWCFGNIAAAGVEMRDLVLGAGVLEPLLLGLSQSQDDHDGSISFMRTGAWALNNLCRGLPPPPLSAAVLIIKALRPLIESANTADGETLVDAGWAIYNITRGGSDRIDAVRSAGLLSTMPDMLLHDDVEVVRPVLRAMENLACSSAAHRGALVGAGALEPLVEVLGNDNSKVRADALRLLSCIAAGSPDLVDAVASTADVVRSVVTELEEGNASCRREAAWVFLNMCECGYKSQESIIPDIVRNGGISAVCQNLYKDNDAESLLVALSLLFTILDRASSSTLPEYVTLVQEADGFAKTLCLADEHDDMEIYDKMVPQRYPT